MHHHPDAITVLERADVMARAADRLRPAPSAEAPEGGSVASDPAPYLLLRSLATELTLKALLAASKGRYPRLHSLRALLGDLPDEEKRALNRLHRRLWSDHHPGRDPSEADAVLTGLVDAAGDLFQQARYPFEHDLRTAPDPEPLRLVARARLLEITRT